MHKPNHALQYSIYKHNNANSSLWLKTLDIKISLKKEHAIIFKCYHTQQYWFHKRSCEKLTTFVKFLK